MQGPNISKTLISLVSSIIQGQGIPASIFEFLSSLVIGGLRIIMKGQKGKRSKLSKRRKHFFRNQGDRGESLHASCSQFSGSGQQKFPDAGDSPEPSDLAYFLEKNEHIKVSNCLGLGSGVWPPHAES